MALFKTVTEIKEYIPVSIGEGIESILPDIKWAEDMYIIPTLGREQYEALEEAYQDDDLDPKQELLLAKVQMPLIHLAYSKAFVVSQVQIDGAGISIVTDAKRKTAFQWQIEELKEDYAAEKGFNGLDFLLSFLEDNKADYPLWASSDAYTVTRQFFINSTSDFNRWVNIGDSRRTFLALWPIMRVVEEINLEPVLGSSFYEYLKDKIVAGTLTDSEKTLVAKITPAVAFLTSAEAVLDLPLRIRSGSLVLDSLAAGTGNIKDRKNGPAQDWQAYLDKQRDKGMTYIGRLKDYLQATASDTVFSIFYNSDLYIYPEERTTTYTNRSDSGSFLL